MPETRSWPPDKPSSLIKYLLDMEEAQTGACLQEFGPSVVSNEHGIASLLSVVWQVNRIDKTDWPLWKQIAFVSFTKAQRLSFAAFRLACLGYPTESLILQRTHYEIIAVNAYGACHPERANAGRAVMPGSVSPKNFIEGEMKCDFSELRNHFGTQAHGLKADISEEVLQSWAQEGDGVHPGFGWKPDRVGLAFAVLNLLRWMDAALLLDYFPGLSEYVVVEKYSAMVADLRDHLGERTGWPSDSNIVAEGDHFIGVVRAAIAGDDWKAVARSRQD